MKALLIYRNEIDGELLPEDIRLQEGAEEYESQKIMNELIECTLKCRTTIITTVSNNNIRIPIYKVVKIFLKGGYRHVLYRLVAVEVKK